MKTSQERYNERLTRIQKAIALEEPDRTPIHLDGPGFIKYGDPSAVLADHIRRPEWAEDAFFKSREILPEIDTAPLPGFKHAVMGAMWFSETKLPGRELSEDSLWQIDEVGPMTEADYDTIVNKGWKALSGELLFGRLGYTPEQLAPNMEKMTATAKRTTDAGLVTIPSLMLPLLPFELISSARSVSKFYRDLHRIPEKVIAAMDVVMEDLLEGVKTQIKAVNPLAVFIGGQRATGEFLNLKMFEKLYWPYNQKAAEAIIGEGSTVWFHCDSNWDANVPYFTEFPKGKCVFDPDGLTDIFKAKEILGDNMCITGDVHPSLLAIGTPDEVYNYARKIKEEIGPKGFIMNSGCSVPPNASLANIKALIAAATGK